MSYDKKIHKKLRLVIKAPRKLRLVKKVHKKLRLITKVHKNGEIETDYTSITVQQSQSLKLWSLKDNQSIISSDKMEVS